ncbi:MAG: rhomboid family intramembrane serine protease [Anaerolineaceae bacterium]|nr:rhomboid family intramembrane serine protease [Anaerolineaceae bacterium]
MEDRHPQTDLWSQLQVPLKVIGGFIVLLWILEIVDQFIFSGGLDSFGVRPRTITGLWGILWAPFLHGGFRHLFANTGPILVLGSIVMLSRPLRDFFKISFIVIIISGLGTWLIAPRGQVHLGASGLIFGYFGFLLLSAYFERSCRAIVIALVVLLLYSGIIWGALPQGNGISWQTHLFGFIGGGVSAYLIYQQKNNFDMIVPNEY